MKDSKTWQALQNQWKELSQWQTLQNQTCASIGMLQGPTISVVDINVGGIDCGTGGVCPTDLICTNDGCMPPDMLPVVVTFGNSGDIDGSIGPALSVNDTATGIVPNEGVTITVPAGGMAVATFSGVTLARGMNNICASWA